MDLVKGVVDASDVIRPQFAGHTSTLIDEPASAGAEKSGSSSSSSSAVVVVERQRLQSTVFFPVFDSHDMATRKPVAVLVAIMDWATFLDIPPNSDGLVIVLAVECDVPYTYKIEGGELRLLGEGDLHDSKYDSFEVRTDAPYIC